jgi:murein L,D-transpeptidase YafK
MEGDYQVPEGFYTINHFNPFSNYYLSMGVSYPNESDRILGVKGKLGGSIYIHGSCCTIGCIPITDTYIKELYIMGIEAKNNGQANIPVHIFPFRMDGDNWDNFETKFPDLKQHVDFWKNIQPGYHYFEKNKSLPKVTVSSDGKYVIS